MKYIIFNFEELDRKTKKVTLKQNRTKAEIIAVKSLVDDEKTIAYTNLKKYKNDAENLISLENSENGMYFQFLKKKKFYHRISGYVPVARSIAPNITDTIPGDYIGLLKFNFLLLLIPIILAILIALPFCVHSDDKPKISLPIWEPVIDQNIGEDEENSVPQQKPIQMKGFSEWYVPAGKSENLKILLSNPKDNPCYFSFEIYLKGNDELLYKSALVPPGEEIKHISISRALPAGTYDAYLHIITQRIDTGGAMNDANLDFQITVK